MHLAEKWTAVLAIFLVAMAMVVPSSFLIRETPHHSATARAGVSARNEIHATALVTAAKTYPIRIGITGTVSHVYVHEGNEVEEGQSLLEIDGHAHFRAPFRGTVTALGAREGETVFPTTVLLVLTDLRDRSILLPLSQENALRTRRGQPVTLRIQGMEYRKNGCCTGQVESVYPNGQKFYARIRVKDLPDEVLPGMLAQVEIRTEIS